MDAESKWREENQKAVAGLAFPGVTAIGHSDFAPGLTKRELFAALAMQGYCARQQSHSLQGPTDIALEAVYTADALMQALDAVPLPSQGGEK